MEIIINSILNLVANTMMFVGGFLFYYHFLTKKMNKITYNTMRVFTALLLTGSLSRVFFDINILYCGKNIGFNPVEAAIALSRNLGLGGILIYLTYKFKSNEKLF
jgi:hypothetical protein